MFLFIKKVALKLLTKNSAIFLFFLLLSIVFWGMHSIGSRKELNVSLPIKYVNLPKDVHISSKLPHKSLVVIKDDNISFIKSIFYKTPDSLNIDLSKVNLYNANGSKTIVIDTIVEKVIEQHFNKNSVVLSIEPKIIVIDYSTMITKTVPVLLSDSVEIKQQHILEGSITIEPRYISIYGTKFILDSVKSVYVEPLNLDSVSKNINIKKNLKKIDNVNFGTNKVSIKILVSKATEKSVTTPINCVNVPKGYNIRTFPSDITIKVLAPLNRFESINSDSFEVVFDYNRKISNNSGVIEVSRQPDNIKVLGVSPSKIEFSLEDTKI